MKNVLIITLWLISREYSASGIEVRLVGGISTFEGRVEVYHNQTWGTICDDGFDNVDAQVLCSMLGFERDGAWAMGQAFYGEGNGTIWLDDLGCDGTEISVKDCSRRPWGEHDCSHFEDAGIVCKPLKIRLTGGEKPYEGRIEVFQSQNWGTVCDSSFDTIQAQVLCQVLGYPSEGAVAYGNAYFGQGSGSVWLSNIDCEVQDPYFLNCRNISLLPSNCDHTKDAGIRCKSNTRVRLVGGPSAYEGRVEVFLFNTWGTVCDDSFDTYDAQVFCHMLGYSRNGSQAVSKAFYGEGSGKILLDELSCDGTEMLVDECSGNIHGIHDCTHSEDAGIVCNPLETRCSSLSPVNNGRYSQSSCTVSTSPVGFTCLLICLDGFKQSNNKSTTCLTTGNWDVSDELLACEDINECEEDPCNETQTCENKQGTFDCRCNEGYTRSLDNETCIDINECDFNNGGCGNTCTNEIGTFVCSCRHGYYLLNDSLTCSDIDECNIDNALCEQQCINAEGSYFCSCDQGYYLQNDSYTCGDFNECELDNGQCDQICNNTEGSFFCDCHVGYEKENDSISCTDLNECFADNGGCHHLCRNEIGSYSCDCDQGYFLQNDLTTCEDVNECDLNNGNCEQICTNGNGTFSCGCFSGYALQYDNRSCIDINECDISNGGCDQICTNENGSYSCSCRDGYILETNTFSCKDIDECLTNNGGCSQRCNNTAGNFWCSCVEGFSLNNDTFTCADKDECDFNNGGCGNTCTNVIGTFVCSCRHGYYLLNDSLTCSDIDECNIDNGLCEQQCINAEGSYFCSCDQGYYLQNDSYTCGDVNECELDNGQCDQLCNNTEGSFFCYCNVGYEKENDSISCIDLNECFADNGGCHHLCLNEIGSYSCNCDEGYFLQNDLTTCKDVNECDLNNGNCEQICTNGNGTFSCGCFSGYALQYDNRSCIDINECDISNGGCDHICSNENGSYSCSCRDGYILETNTFSCKDIDECLTNNGGCSQRCNNIAGNFWCSCIEGFSLSNDTFTCADEDECDFNNGGCGNTCTNVIGTFVCSCRHGYYLLNDSLTCSDIDECNIDNGLCEQQCINAEGSYFCSCDQGYYLQNDTYTCGDVNECELDNEQCDQICNNTEGSFFCDCHVGYEKENDSISCKDLNECIADNGGCHHLCRNEIGSYSCNCDQGYFLQNDLTSCEDVNECDLKNEYCEQICTNGNGTYSCGCFAGYALQYDNRSCIDINECDISNGGCEEICSNENGSYSCSCRDGYILETNTFSCKDIDECLTNNGGCSQRCNNTAGNFFCTCEKGYYLENDTFTCSDVDECEINNGDCDQLCKNFMGFYTCDCEKGFTLNIDNVSCDDITECDTNNGGCQQICTNLKGSFICSCKTGHILNKDGFSCKNVLQNSVSSSLNVLTDVRKVTTLQDPVIYRTLTEHLQISLQTYFKNYTFLPFSVVLQQIREQRNVSEQENKASVIINYTIVYDNKTIPTIRDNLIRGTFGFNVWTPFVYNGERMMAKLVNEGPTILPIRLVTNITEDAPIGTVVGEFKVHDPDDDERGEISVYSDDKPKELTIGPIVNEIVQLVLEGKLDADKYRDNVKQGKAGPVLNFSVMVKDKPGLVASANVSLMIIDVNDNSPICNPSGVTVKIPRDSQISMNICSLDTACQDKDYFYKDAIYVMEDDTCSAFGIHTSGELYVNGEILSNFSSCMVTVNVSDVDNPLYSTKLDVTIKFFECPSDVDHLQAIWQRGIPGRIMYGQCPEGYTGKVTRFCDKDGVYHDPVYNCTKREIAELFEKVRVLNENTSASDVLEELANVTTTAHVNESLLVGDLEAVNTVMSKLTEIIEVKPENIERIADSFIETANNILDESTTTSWTSKMNQTGSGADIVLENLDNFVEKIANVSTTTGKLKVKKSNLYLAVGTVGDCEGNGIQFPKRTDGDVPEWAEKTLDRVQMPCDEKMSFKSYSSVLYRNLSKILPSTFVNKSTNDRQLNGPVMSFTYFPKPEQDLASPIELTFQLYNSSLEKPVCSFWSKDNSLTGAWSSAGCWLDRFTSDRKTVVCKCNHLTNFAVLMSPSPFVSPDHNVALSTISMIGCILSMFCLASTIGIYGFFWRTVKSEKSIMNVNLCCVLFIAYLLFLVGVNKTENETVCTAIAVLLHLVYLIVFFIMLSEGLILANTVLYPFSTRKPGVPLLIASYVMAIFIVAISMAAVKLQGYGGEKSCWLSTSSGLVWAFLAPVLLIIAINIIITTLVIKKLFTTAAMSKKTDKEKAKAGVRSIIILMPIMGVTWILGVFSVSDDTVVFQYLFALFNSVQGVLIFVFHCVINRKVQEALRKKMSRWHSLRSYDFSKSYTQSMGMKSTRVTDESTSAM